MLPKINRISAEKEIKQAQFTKFRHKTPFVNLSLKFVGVNNRFRVLVIISKKISKKANQRNKIRRRIHHILEAYFKAENFQIATNWIIQVHNKQILNLKYTELSLDLTSGLDKLKKQYIKPR